MALMGIQSFARTTLINLVTGNVDAFTNSANSTGITLEAERVFASSRG